MVDGDPSIWVKMEGEQEDLPMVCTGAVLREADLYKTWMPFVTRSDILKWKGQASLLGHFEITVPLMFRDAVIHAYACDTLTQVS